MPELPQELRDGIRDLWPDGWWHDDGREAFEELAADLLAHGYTADEAQEFLATASGAVAKEYGD